MARNSTIIGSMLQNIVLKISWTRTRDLRTPVQQPKDLTEGLFQQPKESGCVHKRFEKVTICSVFVKKKHKLKINYICVVGSSISKYLQSHHLTTPYLPPSFVHFASNDQTIRSWSCFMLIIVISRVLL